MAASIKGDPLLARPPVVLMTSLGDTLDAATMAKAGLAACLTKPVRQSALFDALQTVLAPGGAAPAAAEAKPAPGGHRRVLVVEDNSVNQKVILLQLKKLGHSADAVASGKEALATLEKIGYDLILMDCQMPEMDGYEATREIRRREGASGGRRMPIVALTANALPEDRQKCFAAGMDDYLAKPVRLDELSRAITGRADSVVKHDTVLELREMAGPEGFQHIRLEFFRSTEKLLADLHAAADAGDAEVLRRAAHTLKGASGSLGASGLESLCRELETALASPDATGLRGLVARMASEFVSVKRALENA